MTFSIITPVHQRDAYILAHAAQSLQRQGYRDFEWVLVPNNEALGWDFRDVPLPSATRIVPYLEPTRSIGQIKQFAFSQGTGDWLVELDWDDLLTDDALEVLAQHTDGADFLFSNVAYFTGDFVPGLTFSGDHGWVQRPFVYQGRALHETVAFPADPASILWIGYAPDHVRCWRREFYHRIGRHHAHLPVADDHDLIVRTWLNNGVMRHVDQCLYLYRAEHNTVASRCAEIQERSADNYKRYLEPVALEWAKRQGLRAINLHVGHVRSMSEYESVNLWDVNLDNPWPFEDNSVGVVRAYGAFEHLRDKQHTMREVHRILAPGGFLLSRTPSALGQAGWADPTHVSRWVKNSFLYYTDCDYARYIRNTDVRFLTQRLLEDYPNEWCREQNLLQVTFEAQALKGAYRPPGFVRI